jgi:hypothetical protein
MPDYTQAISMRQHKVEVLAEVLDVYPHLARVLCTCSVQQTVQLQYPQLCGDVAQICDTACEKLCGVWHSFLVMFHSFLAQLCGHAVLCRGISLSVPVRISVCARAYHL